TVAKTPEIDLYCSASDWILPAHTAFAPEQTAFMWRSENGYLAFALEEQQRILMPLELSWGFPSPLIGESPESLVVDLAVLLATERRAWKLCAVGGIIPGSRAFRALIIQLGEDYRLHRGESTRRYRAWLHDGVDGFLSRRPRDFRKSLRRSRAKANSMGMTFERVPDDASAEAVYERVLDVDRRSWKGREGVGLASSSMALHYRLQTERLLRRGALRLWFARHEDRDVGYILGGLFASTYRGLQFAYDDAYAPVGLGNLMQLVTIESVAAEGIALYDLGSDVDYKARWGDECFETMTVLIAA
ncbi:MAG TPA: GNAT family N-acetyltransferase, partial [Myxococcota bacterium]|nr:GNAT family N-acetyltransferase [Myxococcota bacterium]